MDQSLHWRWLVLAAAMLAAFLAAVSIYMERLQGLSFIVLCFVAALLGSGGYIWARGRVLPVWERLPRAKRVILVALAAAIVLAARLIANRHKPNQASADLMVGVSVLVALALLGLYRLMSHRVDAPVARTSRR